jgi:hypothetical protein
MTNDHVKFQNSKQNIIMMSQLIIQTVVQVSVLTCIEVINSMKTFCLGC